MNWPTMRLGDVTVNFDAQRRPVKGTDRVAGKFPYYGASGIVDHVDDYLFDGRYLLVAEDGENLRSRSLPIAFMAGGSFWVNNHAHVLQGNELAKTEYLCYALSLVDFDEHITGSTQPKLTKRALESIEIPVPSLLEQGFLADFLGAFAEKITVNGRLVELLSTRFEAILDAAIDGAGVGVRLGDLAEFHNKRRVPLSARQRELRVGDVPYWGANGVLGSVDEAIFDEIVVLVGEDGSVVRGDGKPFVHYVWGPSWVNNHAHVITGRGVSTDLLSYLVRRADVSQFVTGAVQPKLSMGNLKRLELRLPGGADMREVESQVAVTQARIRAAQDESRTLTALRDTLLRAFMSGRLSVRDAEAAVSEVV